MSGAADQSEHATSGFVSTSPCLSVSCLLPSLPCSFDIWSDSIGTLHTDCPYLPKYPQYVEPTSCKQAAEDFVDSWLTPIATAAIVIGCIEVRTGGGRAMHCAAWQGGSRSQDAAAVAAAALCRVVCRCVAERCRPLVLCLPTRSPWPWPSPSRSSSSPRTRAATRRSTTNQGRAKNVSVRSAGRRPPPPTRVPPPLSRPSMSSTASSRGGRAHCGDGAHDQGTQSDAPSVPFVYILSLSFLSPFFLLFAFHSLEQTCIFTAIFQSLSPEQLI